MIYINWYSHVPIVQNWNLFVRTYVMKLVLQMAKANSERNGAGTDLTGGSQCMFETANDSLS